MTNGAISPLVELLRCLECGAAVQQECSPAGVEDGWLTCSSCAKRYPVVEGTPRMLSPDAGADDGSVTDRTARSFAYEWSHFGRPRSEWRKNFLDYMQPHNPDFFAGKLVLDVGTGSGRHSAEAAALGARVIAVDVGQSIDVARRNLPPSVLTVQADAERLPFADGIFDCVMSIGVLHHLRDTERALRGLVRLVRPGGNLHIYLYWVPEVGWHRSVLRLVAVARKVTTRMPFGLLRLLCYPLSVALWLGIVLPYRGLRARAWAAPLARTLPLKTYADYPFGVLVNDQFDRLSAPIEQRFTQSEVQAMLERAGLESVSVIAHHGWVGDGRRPSSPVVAPEEKLER